VDKHVACERRAQAAGRYTRLYEACIFFWCTTVSHLKSAQTTSPFLHISLPSSHPSAVKSDLCDASVESVSGYFNITGTRDAAYFYWLFESRGDPSTDPLVVWLTGGPVGGEGGGREGGREGATHDLK